MFRHDSGQPDQRFWRAIPGSLAESYSECPSDGENEESDSGGIGLLDMLCPFSEQGAFGAVRNSEGQKFFWERIRFTAQLDASRIDLHRAVECSVRGECRRQAAGEK